ncbi:hypothetical protein BASA50_002778 [Batrachochytrium salamandrivorans]|uniref:N-acetyltransferase domain-containing protein n=1 Tax=Batrachochytrium salamandrivorans TaxID=1357716 RepID=A0ABQ8FK92_9FUNG|nr:hypothetical protein BASA60_008484 [Batrachochytrium salamandrivorans]KAH6599753.1 hypothetical protein BASA50_002778 [Batrachochytrium salamandrivorans]KAH9274072.1 hypothetical protein BASA83_003714 [Batrachochytrium salamandrivorans]KAJ1332442.1 hypothetical protein BSLG_008744 [Batrachochytrium salamandrivorans]
MTDKTSTHDVFTTACTTIGATIATTEAVPTLGAIIEAGYPTPSSTEPSIAASPPSILYEPYVSEEQLPQMAALIDKDLSEPYSAYTYRHFLQTHPTVSYVAKDSLTGAIIGVIICKLDMHRQTLRGYIGMLTVDCDYRKIGIGSSLVKTAVLEMKRQKAAEVVLETESTNKAALALYERLGFVKDKRLNRYYMNGVDAFR